MTDVEPAPGCGTYAGYQRHRKAGEQTCPACREAHRAYMREWRSRGDDWRRGNRARARALWRLAALHPEEYEHLVVVELRAEQ